MAAEAGGPVKFLPVTHAAPPGIHLLPATRGLPVTKTPVQKDQVGLQWPRFNVWLLADPPCSYFSRYVSFLVHSSPGLQFPTFRAVPVHICSDLLFSWFTVLPVCTPRGSLSSSITSPIQCLPVHSSSNSQSSRGPHPFKCLPSA